MILYKLSQNIFTDTERSGGREKGRKGKGIREGGGGNLDLKNRSKILFESKIS